MNNGQFKDNNDIREQYKQVSGETFQRSPIEPLAADIPDWMWWCVIGLLSVAALASCVYILSFILGG